MANCAFQIYEMVLRHECFINNKLLVEPAAGLEPATYGLQNRCSAS